MIKNNRGGITLDFIFAFVLIMGLSGILFSLSLTLTVSSITQYMTFAAARNLMASHHDSNTQGALANQKFQTLVTHPTLAPLFRGQWFELENPFYYPDPGSLTSSRPGYQNLNQPPQAPDLFVGYAVTLIARMLDFQIPFYGSTTDEGDGRGSGFRTEVGSFISKEPSEAQCENFNLERWKAIRQLNVPSGSADYSTNTQETGYVHWMNDNGC